MSQFNYHSTKFKSPKHVKNLTLLINDSMYEDKKNTGLYPFEGKGKKLTSHIPFIFVA